MTIKNDVWIRESKIINPCAEFTNTKVHTKMEGGFDVIGYTEKCISYGISSYRYDARCFDEFKIFTTVNNSIIDPKRFDEGSVMDFKGGVCTIPPNSFILARTLEYFKIPRGILGICIGKSTYARCGIICNTTPLEPEWEGYITIELSNTTPLPAKIYAGEGIAQVIFLESDKICETSYKDRKGKYQGQLSITLPKV